MIAAFIGIYDRSLHQAIGFMRRELRNDSLYAAVRTLANPEPPSGRPVRFK